MTCFHPKLAYEYTLVDGTKKLSFQKTALNYLNARELPLPCYWCSGCRADRQQEWATRIIHEAEPHGDQNIFITLTYATQNLTADGTLVKSHFQNFMKKLRKRIAPEKVRYYMAGEYGNICTAHGGYVHTKVKDKLPCYVCKIGRPHYHVILFNYRPTDEYKWAIRKGNQCYRSETIEKCWQHGTSEYGLLTPASARYVAGYILKKITGEKAEEHYRLPSNSGNYHYALPEYNNMSLKPGLGTTWYEKYYRDIFPDDFVMEGDRKKKVPKYYMQLLREKHPDFYEEIKLQRRDKALLNSQKPNQPSLEARETCHQAKLNRKEQSL